MTAGQRRLLPSWLADPSAHLVDALQRQRDRAASIFRRRPKPLNADALAQLRHAMQFGGDVAAQTNEPGDAATSTGLWIPTTGEQHGP